MLKEDEPVRKLRCAHHVMLSPGKLGAALGGLSGQVEELHCFVDGAKQVVN